MISKKKSNMEQLWIIPTIFLIVSEVMPFLPGNRGHGILHALYRCLPPKTQTSPSINEFLI